VRKPGEAVIEVVPSNCRRDVGSGIFSGNLAIDCADAMNGHRERMYQQKLYRDEWVRRDEVANRGGEEVSGLDSCLRVESVGEGQENEDGMCWRTCRLCASVSSCPHSRCRVPGDMFAHRSLGNSWFGVDKPSVSSISVSLTIPVHFCNQGGLLRLSQMNNTE
jgi:hypothetical protein